MIHEAIYLGGLAWLGVLLGVCVVQIGRAATPARRIVALDLLALVLIGLVALVAGEDEQPFALEAALALALLSFVATLAVGRYWGLGRPF